MAFLQILKDKSQLDGTAYFELLPGKYKEKCWNEGSLFLDEETFGFFETIVESCVPEYDHYAFIEVLATRWQPVIARLKRLATELESAVTAQDIPVDIDFYFNDTKQNFKNDLAVNLQRLRQVSIELVGWLAATLKQHEEVSILGL